MGIMVSGGVVRSYIDAFRLFPHVPSSVLAKHRLGTLSDATGELSFDATTFYPFEQVVAALRELAAMVGPKKMFEVGLAVPKNAILPPGATDIRSAMAMFDAGYHLNHRKDGRAMFDPSTGKMLEGIGHYRCTLEPQRILLDVDVVYECDFDRGIITAWARRFEPRAALTHLEPETCRKHGARRCRYALTW